MPPPLCSPVSVYALSFPFDLSLGIPHELAIFPPFLLSPPGFQLLTTYPARDLKTTFHRHSEVSFRGNILPAQIAFRRVYFRVEIISSLSPPLISRAHPAVLISFLLLTMLYGFHSCGWKLQQTFDSTLLN